MEEKERFDLRTAAEDGNRNGRGNQQSSSKAQHPPIKRCVRIEETAKSPTSQAKQASIRIHEARDKAKIKVRKVLKL